MSEVKLRPHHAARLIEHQSNITTLIPALHATGYDPTTIDSAIRLLQSLIVDPLQQVEIVDNDGVGEDSICALCTYNNGRQCTLPNSTEIGAHNSADLRESVSYGLRPGLYTVQELLDRKPAIHPKTRL